MSSKQNNGLNLFFIISLTILLVIIVSIVIISSYFAFRYNSTKKTFDKFTMMNLEHLMIDIGSSYNLNEDPGDFKNTVSKMSKDMIDSLLSYYDGNMNTVIITLRNLTTSKLKYEGDFSKDALTFVLRVVENIPTAALKRSVYLERFFGLIYLTLKDETQKSLIEQIIKEIKDILDKQ